MLTVRLSSQRCEPRYLNQGRFVEYERDHPVLAATRTASAPPSYCLATVAATYRSKRYEDLL